MILVPRPRAKGPVLISCWFSALRLLLTVAVLMTSWTGRSSQAFLVSRSGGSCNTRCSWCLHNEKKNGKSLSSSSAAQDLIEKAARIRAEIATLEGKTLQQVEQEAMEKKQRENTARVALTQQRIVSETLYRQTRTERLGRALYVPTTRYEMVQQCARAVERAMADGRMRQTIRFALLESDEQSIYDANNNMWPGGAAQMSRLAAKPTTQALFQELRMPQPPQRHPTLSNNNNNNNNIIIKKNTAVMVQDVWDFDGSAMVRLLAKPCTKGAATALGGNENNNNDNGAAALEPTVVRAQALVFANTDVKYTKDIQALLLEQQRLKSSDGSEEPLLLLVNPFWRDIDSWGINILAPGAKRLAQQVIFNNNSTNNATTIGGGLSDETYSCRRFQCRGEECIAIKAYPYDWQIFAYWEGESSSQQYGTMMSTIRLGECKDEPKTDFVTNLLNQRPEFKLSRTMRQMKR